MRITKIGHCCLLLETKGKRILTDPGRYTTEQDLLKDIDIIVITHEHGDHIHIHSVEALIKNNPSVTLITNSSVGKLLEEKEIVYTNIDENREIVVEGIPIISYDGLHAQVHESKKQVQMSSYLIDNTFYYAGDAFIVPKESISILAVPVMGSWMKLSEAITFAQTVQPHYCIPVHDGLIRDGLREKHQKSCEKIFTSLGLHFVRLNEGETCDLDTT